MRIQDYEIFTKHYSASFKTGTENIFPIGKFTTNNRVATTSIFNVQAPHSSAHAGSLLYRTRFYSLYTFEQQKTPQLIFHLFQPNFS